MTLRKDLFVSYLEELRKKLKKRSSDYGKKKLLTHTNIYRGEINILLCGDPGTSKSQLLACVHRVAPKSELTFFY